MEVKAVYFVYAFVASVVALIIWKGLESILRSRLVPKLTDKYVLVTGCDSGFGNLVTRQLDRKGVRVFAACLTSKGQKDLEEKTSERVITLRLDVTDHGSVEEACKFVQGKLPKDTGLWGLVNNAGVGTTPGLIAWSTKQDYERVIGVNLMGVIDVTLTFLPLLRKARGRVVNVASALARVALGAGGYAESKYGVQAFSDTLRRESHSQGYGIKVSILEPGFFKTQITDPDRVRRDVKGAWDRLSREQQAQFDPTLHEKTSNSFINFMDFVTSPNQSIVTNAMVHALTSTWPKTRYTCGLDMRLIFIPFSHASTWFTDLVFWLFINTDTPKEKGSRTSY